MPSKQPSVFMSYPPASDADGRITRLRNALEQELTLLTGYRDFTINTHDNIGIGEHEVTWVARVLAAADFLVPIIQPLFFTEVKCRDVLDQFFQREESLGRNDLVLPIYYIQCSELHRDASDPLMREIAARNHDDWRKLRRADDATVADAVFRLAERIHNAFLRTSPPPPPAPPAPLAPSQPGRRVGADLAADAERLDALVDLLLSLFSSDEFLRFLRFGRTTAGILPYLPSGAVAPAKLFLEAAEALRRGKQLDDEFFARLVAERPRRESEIRRVQALFGAPR